MKNKLILASLTVLLASCGGGGESNVAALGSGPITSSVVAAQITGAEYLDTQHWVTGSAGAFSASTSFRAFQRFATSSAGRLSKVHLNICAGATNDPQAMTTLEIRRGAEMVGSPVVGTFQIPNNTIPKLFESGCAFNIDNTQHSVVVDTSAADIQVADNERLVLVVSSNQPNSLAATWWWMGTITDPKVFPAGWSAVSTDTATYFNSVDAYKFKTFLTPVIQPWGFGGFLRPIDNLPTTNSVNAGSSVPIKFQFTVDQGLDIFDGGAPSVVQASCDFTSVSVVNETVTTAGASTLGYDHASNTYTYVWKTEKSWAGECRQLVVAFKDGSTHRANFKFK